MTTYQCEKGCLKNGQPRWHYTRKACDYEPSYDPAAKEACQCRGLKGPGTATASVDPPPQKAIPPPRAPEPVARAPDRTGITFRDSPASVVKGAGASATATPVLVDYIVDGAHTKALCNFGFRCGYWVTVQIDDIVFHYPRHIPRALFALSPTALMSIEQERRNWYSVGVTRFCKMCGCKTVEEAHRLIDGIVFFETFGGIIVVVFMHYREAAKSEEYAKVKAERAKKRAEMGSLVRGRHTVIETTGRELAPSGVPA